MTNSTSDTKQPWWKAQKENLKIIAIALLVSFSIRVFIAEPRYIPSDSMYPSLYVGDRIVVEKVSYRFGSPQPGDIVVFQPPPLLQRQGYGKGQAFIKRIIARGGQTVAVRDGVVYIDDRPLQEDYIAEPPRYNLLPVTVPEGKLFVMGDNRNNSNDSHVWGFLPQQNIIGRAWVRFWPVDRLNPLGKSQ